VFQLSYDALDPARRQLFRLLGVHPGPDITAAAAAALAGIEPVDAEHALESLLDEHLLEQTVPDRYHLHELLHTYAAGHCASHDTPDERATATTRLLDWYVAATDAATTVIRPFPVPIRWQGPPSPTPGPRFADEQQGFAWLDAEYPSLVAMIRLASDGPWYAHAIQLTHLLRSYFIKRGLNKDRIMLQQRAEKAARRLGDTNALAHTLTDLGSASILTGDILGATTYLRQALDLHRQLADRRGEATTLGDLGVVYSRLGRHSEALDYYGASLDLLRDYDDVFGQATLLSSISIEMHLLGRDREALHLGQQAIRLQLRRGERGLPGILNLAWICGRLEQHTDAIEYTRRALELYPPGLGGFGEIVALVNLSFSYARVNRQAEAVSTGHRALALAKQLAYPDAEVEALNTLAEAYRLAGDHPAARQRHSDALTLATQTGNADEQSRARQGIALLSYPGESGGSPDPSGCVQPDTE
jgi:tetratricopeptide (TPR) repeat protein